MSGSRVFLRQIDVATVKRIEELAEKDFAGESITLLINCKGGDVYAGLKIIKAISRSKTPFIGHVKKEAGSMAAVILQACHERVMESDASLHYHYGSWRVSFLIYFDQKMMKRNTKKAIELQELLIMPIVRRTGMKKRDVHKLLAEDKKFSAEACLQRGLIDRIVVPICKAT